MPFTLAHPAAILPLRRRWPALSLSALVIGSLVPDLPYYLPLPEMRMTTHSLTGSVLFALPVGLALWLLWQVLKRPLCLVLPQPHRGALLPLAEYDYPREHRTFLAVGAALLLGTWTHLVWDAFTHRLSWGPLLLPFLRWQVLSVAGKSYQLCECLQWLCSAVGVLILGLAYRGWLRRTVPSARAAEPERYAWLAGLGVLAVLAALPFARYNSGHFDDGWRAFAFEAWVHAAAFYCVLLVGYALLRALGRRR